MRFLQKVDNEITIDKIRNDTFRDKWKIKPQNLIIDVGWFAHIKIISEEKKTRTVCEACLLYTSRCV